MILSLSDMFSGRKGVTLVEMLVTIAVLATLALAAERLFAGGIAAWSFTGEAVEQMGADRMARVQLKSDLSSARTTSILNPSSLLQGSTEIYFTDSENNDIIWRFSVVNDEVLTGQSSRLERSPDTGVSWQPILDGLQPNSNLFFVDNTEEVRLITVRLKHRDNGNYSSPTMEIMVNPRN